MLSGLKSFIDVDLPHQVLMNSFSLNKSKMQLEGYRIVIYVKMQLIL